MDNGRVGRNIIAQNLAEIRRLTAENKLLKGRDKERRVIVAGGSADVSVEIEGPRPTAENERVQVSLEAQLLQLSNDGTCLGGIQSLIAEIELLRRRDRRMVAEIAGPKPER